MLALGDAQALRKMSAREFRRWMWYEQIEPFGEVRADYRTALVAAEVANLNPNIKYRMAPKDGKMVTIGERLLKFGEEPKAYKQPVDEQLQIIKVLAMMGGVKD